MYSKKDGDALAFTILTNYGKPVVIVPNYVSHGLKPANSLTFTANFAKTTIQQLINVIFFSVTRITQRLWIAIPAITSIEHLINDHTLIFITA
jgi:hypothetical protein